jgi:hypothetical protein
MKCAVIYHDITEGKNYDLELIHIGNDLEEACGAMFNHFDDNNGQESKRCLMVGGDMGNHKGIVYFVVDLNDPPFVESDYQYLSRYYILRKEVYLC